MKPKNQ
ncbi:hypothetical protein FQN60_007935 [Etheostoma spectabile]|nr:hypothetical protein FQN60_007935 [Etheostoma spectabile]